MRLYDTVIRATRAALLVGLSLLGSTAALAQATDPGVRHAAADNGPPPPLAGLTAERTLSFSTGWRAFRRHVSVTEF